MQVAHGTGWSLLTSSKEQDLSPPQPQRIELANNSDELELGFIPAPSRKEGSSGDTLVLAQRARLYLDSDQELGIEFMLFQASEFVFIYHGNIRQ